MRPDGNRTMIGIPAGSLSAVHGELGRGRPAAEAADLARRVGFALGPGLARAFQEDVSGEVAGGAGTLEPERFWSILAEFLASAGWGRVAIDDRHPGVVSLSSADWAEASGRSSAHPSCHLSTGMLAALMSEVAGTDLAVLEGTCRAAGADRCTFFVGGQAALSAVHARMREGAPPTEAVAQLG